MQESKCAHRDFRGVWHKAGLALWWGQRVARDSGVNMLCSTMFRDQETDSRSPAASICLGVIGHQFLPNSTVQED